MDLTALAACLALGLGVQAKPEISYTLLDSPDPEPGAWSVEVEVSGLDPADREVELRLDGWGEWQDLDDYLHLQASEPTLRGTEIEGGRFRFGLPEDWDGRLAVAYRIALRAHGSELQRRYGLLPWRYGEGSYGHAQNVFPKLLVSGEPVVAERRVRLEASVGTFVHSGWGGVSETRQELELHHDIDSCILAFGPEPWVSRSGSGATLCEVVQFGGKIDVSAPLLELAEVLLPAYGERLGQELGRPMRVVLYSTGEESGGGMGTDHGISLGYSSFPDSPYYRQTVAHELYHAWLPSRMPAEGKPVVWFHEGFTDYFALWHLARSGLVERQWFASRLLEMEREARASPAHGRTSFTDPEVRWRDGDGPVETLAYKGGALLAFQLDVALRRRGHAGAQQMIADFLAEDPPRHSIPRIRSWLSVAGLGDWSVRHLERGEPLPPAREALQFAGFLQEQGEIDAHLTYFGVRTDGGEAGGTVLEIDPDGPCANRDLRVGDVIVGYGPQRETRAWLQPGVSTPFDFGLTTADCKGGFGWYADLLRDGESLRVAIEPWLQPGAREPLHAVDPDKLDAFFQ